MSDALKKLTEQYKDNPYITFDSKNNGLSRIYDIEWDFIALGQNKKKVIFNSVAEAQRKNIQSYLFAIVIYIKNCSNSSHITVSAIISYVTSLKKIVQFWGKSDFNLLSGDREWNNFKRNIKGSQSINSLNNVARAINIMGRIGLVNRYVNLKELDELKLYHPNYQNIAFPESIHFKILSTVVSSIEKYHPHRNAISKTMKKAYARLENESHLKKKKYGVIKLTHGMASVTSKAVRAEFNKSDIPDFEVLFNGDWLNNMIVNCIICTELFTGMRKRECITLNKESYEIVNGIPIVKGLTSKGNEGQPIYTTWNTHPIVKQALELAFDATQFHREYEQKKLLLALRGGVITKDQFTCSMKELSSAFISCSLGVASQVFPRSEYHLDIHKLLKKTLKSIGIQATEEDIEEFDLLNPSRAGQLKLGGTLPKLSEHDFRRSFAVFIVRNKLGNAQTIKYQLKHKNLNMSNWYANFSELVRTRKLIMDEGLMSDYDKAMEDAAVDALNDIYNISSVITDVEGRIISESKEKILNKGEQVYMSRDELRTLLKSKEKSLVILPTGGYCTSRDCERLCSMTDITQKKKNCGQVITDKGARKMKIEREELISSFRYMNEFGDYAYSTILSARKKKILIIENILNTHRITYEGFTDKIKAVMV